MRKIRNLLVLVLAVAMALSVVSFSVADSAETREEVTVKYWYPMHPSAIEEDFDHDPLHELLAEKTGVHIEYQLVPNDNSQELYNLMMASGNLPDIVCIRPASLKKYPDAWAPLDDYILADTDRYANLYNTIYTDDYLMSYLPSDDGKNRIVPMLATRLIGDILIVRKDLMETWGYGYDDLVTLDQWHDVLTKAKDEGYIPYMTRYKRAGILYRLLGGYSDCMQEEYYVDIDGKTVKYGVLEPRFKEVVEIARQWYAEGLIDPEYPTTDATIWWEKFLAGDVFATHDNMTRVNAADKDYMTVQNNDMRAMAVGPMQSPETGTRNTTIHYPRVRDKSAAIAASSKYIERILDYFDYCFSEEGFYAMNWGIEGYSYEMVDGMPVTIAEYDEKSSTREIQLVGTRDEPKDGADELIYNFNVFDYSENTRIGTKLYQDNDFIRRNWIEAISFTDAENEEMTAREAELDTYRGEMLDKFIMGIEPMENWDAFVDEIKAMGVEKNIAIYQQGLDRALGN
ncbi:MAG: extracellular solute-binding protein [Clostridia bacterium]|nr:extracellular solute-binding protein [Clostridia bacterium]